MEHHSEKHKELSEQLATWWHTQTDFTTKKALAGSLKVHPDTLGDYFSGRKFPGSDIANRLWEITNIECLTPDVGANSSLEMVPQESPVTPQLPHPSGVAASIEQPREPVTTGPLVDLQDESHLGKNLEVMAGPIPGGLPQKGGRQEERSVVISLQRTTCPFCAHEISALRSCGYCGQHFVWANVLLENGEPM